MPRQNLDIPHRLEHLSVLNEHGELDEELDPDLSDDVLLRMHRAMLLARRFDERMLSLQRQGRLGTFAPVTGQEAAQVGSAAALADDDWVVPSYREIAVNTWREVPLDGILLYNAGFNEGGAVSEDQNMLPPAVPVGTQMLHAAGIAYALRQRDDQRIAMTYFGDGATSEGDFHEAMNFAGVFSCPLVFVCQNNQYAISVPRERQTRSKTLAQKALAYGVPGLQVDGNDVLAVYAAAAEAVARARDDHEPSMIECVTYRLEVHTTVDDPSKYRSDEEVEAWRGRDPLPRFQAYLKTRNLLTDEDVEHVEEEVATEIGAAVDRWDTRMSELHDPSVIFDHLYAELPASLQRQRQAFEDNQAAEAQGQDRSRERADDEPDQDEPDQEARPVGAARRPSDDDHD